MGNTVTYCVPEMLAAANENVAIPILTFSFLATVLIIFPLLALLPLQNVKVLGFIQRYYLDMVRWFDFDTGNLPTALKLGTAASNEKRASIIRSNDYSADNDIVKSKRTSIIDQHTQREYLVKDLRGIVKSIGGLVSIVLITISCYGIWFVLYGYLSPLTQEVIVTPSYATHAEPMELNFEISFPCQTDLCSVIQNNATEFSISEFGKEETRTAVLNMFKCAYSVNTKQCMVTGSESFSFNYIRSKLFF